MDCCSAVLLRVSQLEGRSSDTLMIGLQPDDDRPSSHETLSKTTEQQSIPTSSPIVALSSLILSPVREATICLLICVCIYMYYRYVDCCAMEPRIFKCLFCISFKKGFIGEGLLCNSSYTFKLTSVFPHTWFGAGEV